MNNLTLDNFHKIWESKNLTQNEFPKFVLYFNKNHIGGNLRFQNDNTNKEELISEGNFILENFENGCYLLTIGEKSFEIRLYMPNEEYPSFDMKIPNYNYVRFFGIIK